MKIYDMHIHLGLDKNGDGDILELMRKSGVYGGCIFSPPPKQFSADKGKSFDERLSEVLNFVSGKKDRLFPIMWIHPYEENIIENIDKAIEKGIDGFKIICSDFFVYEEQSINVLKYIASKNKPVFFHTGILWDGEISSQYNRPLNFEALIKINGLKFSVGHCSWPWVDECLALYGKFLNGIRSGNTAEMFLDTTPGTPKIYREELLTKLFTIGYDIGDNILFGTDCNAEKYNSEWSSEWLLTDKNIMDKLGVGENIRKKLYCDNIMRFLGKSSEIKEYRSPTTDNSNSCSYKGNE